MTYGERLRFIRNFRGMTQAELGAACGFGKNGHIFIAQYENGSRVPKKERNECIAKALRVNPKMLMWDSDILYEDIFIQLCWAFILPDMDYPIALMHQITIQEEMYIKEYKKFISGEMSETEYINNKIDSMNLLDLNTEV